ncbi:S8 family peptidase [Idiomarina abyssalis]|uniref:S8 family peptidase n=1 Tax=Idiomarina abyssalis TaxID=86102 RepID=UPI0009EA3037|nr:S8 family peptidase [Idiomarina abyssalis]
MGSPVNYSGDASACSDHGTHVAGTLGGSSYGVAPNVTLHDIQTLGCDGGLKSDSIAGLDWIKANHVKPAVVNMSLGGDFSSAQNAAIQDVVNSGITVVVSAGNDNTDACNQSPASAPDALTVGATEKDDDRASYSNYGTCLDLFAPGSNILSATNSSNTASARKYGTSMAAPHVAGAVANYLEKNPTATPADVRKGIVDNASLNKVNGPGSGSPNRLLYSRVHNANAPSVPQNFNLQDMYCYGKKNASWSASSGNVSHYEIWASPDSDWNYPSKRYETTGISRLVNFNQDRYVRVRACNGEECSMLTPAEYSKYHSACY